VNVPGRPAGRHDWESLTPEAACTLAAWVVDRAVDVREVLEARLNWQEHRQLSLRSLLIGKEMLGMMGRRSHHRQVRLALRSLPFALQQKLNVVDAAGNVVTYRQIEKAMNQITEILADPTVLVDHDHPGADPETGEVIVCPVTCPFMVADHNWYMTAMAQASRPDDIPVADDMCMDWTDVETWAKPLYQFVPDAPRADGDVGDDYHSAVVSPEPQAPEVVSPEPQTPKVVSPEPQTKRATRAGVSGSTKPLAPLGPDGRRVPTKDSDGRYGHRSRRPGMSPNFVGWDNNTLVGAPDRDGGAMAPFLYAAALVPASSYAGDSATTLLRLARHFGVGVRDLIADRGYTRLDPARFSDPVRQMVDNIVLDLLDAQRRRGVDYTVVRDKGKPSQRTIRIKRSPAPSSPPGYPKAWTTWPGRRSPLPVPSGWRAWPRSTSGPSSPSYATLGPRRAHRGGPGRLRPMPGSRSGARITTGRCAPRTRGP